MSKINGRVKAYIIGCAHNECERTVEFGGCDRRTLRDMFGGDKLVATAFVAVQSGWGMEMQPDGTAHMYCPNHAKVTGTLPEIV